MNNDRKKRKDIQSKLYGKIFSTLSVISLKNEPFQKLRLIDMSYPARFGHGYGTGWKYVPRYL